MLNAKLEKYNRIADKAGFIFFCNCIQEGIRSINDLQQLCLHNKECVDLNVTAFTMLLEEMGLLSFEEGRTDTIHSVSDFFLNCHDEDELHNWFCKNYTIFLLQETVLPDNALKYDELQDCYTIDYRAINIKYACYRNLLCSLDILTLTHNGKYTLSPSIIDIFEERKEAMSEEMLMNILEQERLQGDKGEQYVLEFEKNRLRNHPQCCKIKCISKIDVSAGFDIVSFIDEQSQVLDLCIEVKTYSGKPHFFWSKNEMEQAKLRTNHYSIYLVDLHKIDTPNYNPIIINDPIRYLSENGNWLIEAESYSIKQIL